MNTEAQYTTTGIDLFFDTNNATLRSLNEIVGRLVKQLGTTGVESCRYDTHRHCITVRWSPKPVSAAVMLEGLSTYRLLGTDIATAVARATGKAVCYKGSEFYLTGDCVADSLVRDVTALLKEAAE